MPLCEIFRGLVLGERRPTFDLLHTKSRMRDMEIRLKGKVSGAYACVRMCVRTRTHTVRFDTHAVRIDTHSVRTVRTHAYAQRAYACAYAWVRTCVPMRTHGVRIG